MRMRTDSEEGFTLIELMVVVLVVGVLLAIAAPTFLKTQDNAKGKGAQSNARSALSAIKVFHAEYEAFWKTSDANTLSLLRAEEPSLGWVGTMGSASATPDQVSWASTEKVFVIAVQARNGECYYVREDIDTASTMPGTWFGKTVGVACDADDGTPVWKSSVGEGWPASGASA